METTEQKTFYTLDEFNALTQEKRRELFESYTFKFVKDGVVLYLRKGLVYKTTKNP